LLSCTLTFGMKQGCQEPCGHSLRRPKCCCCCHCCCGDGCSCCSLPLPTPLKSSNFIWRLQYAFCDVFCHGMQFEKNSGKFWLAVPQKRITLCLCQILKVVDEYCLHQVIT
jgi:hypothetical protein